ncbi:MAG: hypothetical protein NT079_03755, partial [Candidatus Omnitrophica bacterium]|nr:hypothetical protein [Candidatus Omnitrophota bacterium]
MKKINFFYLILIIIIVVFLAIPLRFVIDNDELALDISFKSLAATLQSYLPIFFPRDYWVFYYEQQGDII